MLDVTLAVRAEIVKHDRVHASSSLADQAASFFRQCVQISRCFSIRLCLIRIQSSLFLR